MVRRCPILIVASLVLFAAGVAAANGLLIGPSPGLAVSGGSVVAQSAPSTTGTTTTPATFGQTTGTPGTTAALGTAAIDQVVAISRSVAPGQQVSAFTVPVARQLVITDVLVTNPGASPACGAAVSPSGTPNGTIRNGANGTVETGTGLLCVPALASLSLGLTTGLEFDAGQSVVLANGTTAGATTPATTLHYHLRGFLVSTIGG